MSDELTDQSGNTVDAEKFNSTASDLKGHSTRITFRCMKGFATQIQLILSSGKFPYRSQGDLIRHALMRLFYWLDTLAPVKGVLPQIEIINKILEQEEFADMFSAVFERASTRIAAYTTSKEKGEAIRLVRTIQDQIMQMEDGYWRDKYMKEVHERWNHLLDQASTVDLSASEEE